MPFPFDLFLAGGGIMVQTINNMLLKRPVYVGIHKHAAFAAIGYLVGMQVNKFRDTKIKEREVIMYDYISRHPEDFDEPPPKKYGEVLLEWHPAR